LPLLFLKDLLRWQKMVVPDIPIGIKIIQDTEMLTSFV
jgi:hypothetical protein